MQEPILSQVQESKLSKQGKTTTTGIFEGQPQNVVIANRSNREVPTAIEKVQAPIDISFNNRLFESDTYLQYLERYKKI